MCPIHSGERATAAERRTNRHEPVHRADSAATTRIVLLRPSRIAWRRLGIVLVIGIGLAGIAAAYVVRDAWLPETSRLGIAAQKRFEDNAVDRADKPELPPEVDAHAGHDHAADGKETSLVLSEQAQRNVGLEVATVGLRDFDRTIGLPATVVSRPGRTEITIAAPMTGIVTRVYPIRGEAVAPGEPLFDLRLTHEDLVDEQSEFLATLEQLDVIRREVARLEKVTASGAIAGKRLLERQYEQQQTEARLRAQRQALVLHGLSEEQIDRIETSRHLLQEVTIFAPRPSEGSDDRSGEHWLQVSRIAVAPGAHVATGDPLAVLSDHAVLHIEGKAFEQDAAELNEAAAERAPITAVVEANDNAAHTVADLRILYVENEVDLESRALRFHVRLPNQLVRNEETDDGHRFVGWRFKPGQRVQLRVPVERWEDRIVLPVDAVVEEGADRFVFVRNGGRFERKSVHVEYRDPRWVVIASDGTLFPGDAVVVSGAYQMHVAMKNKAGGGLDPHAGHHH